MLMRILSSPASKSFSRISGLLPLVLIFIVPWLVLARIMRIAGSITSAASRGSPSQPCPKLTTLFLTFRICSRATSAISSGDGVNEILSWLHGILSFFWSEMHPRHFALQYFEVGSGASYLPRKKFFPAGHPYVSAHFSRCPLSRFQALTNYPD